MVSQQGLFSDADGGKDGEVEREAVSESLEI